MIKCEPSPQPYAYSTLGTAKVFNYHSNFRVCIP